MWYTAQSDARPEEIDINSSKVYVYIRRNIKEISVEDENGDSVTRYEFEETKVDKVAYSFFAPQIDYLAMMTDVDLD